MISKYKKFILGASAFAALTTTIGCGGSGTTVAPTPFPNGIYIATSAAQTYLYTPSLSSPMFQSISAERSTRRACFDANGRLFSDHGTTTLAYRDGQASPWKYYGSFGTGVGGFSSINDIAIDSQQRIYVSDNGNNRIIRMDNITGQGWVELDISSYNPSQGYVGIALDSTNRIYLLIKLQNKVIRLDGMTDSTAETFGSSGTGVNQFAGPSDIEVGPDDKIYLADSGNSRIARFDDMTGTGWTTYGSLGTVTGKFKFPTGIEIDSNGTIYVADTGNYRVVQMNDMTGANWIELGSYGYWPDSGNNSIVDVLVR